MASITFNFKVAGAVALGMAGGMVVVHSQHRFMWDAIQFLGTDDYLIGVFFLLAGAGMGIKLYYDEESPSQYQQLVDEDESVEAQTYQERTVAENTRPSKLFQEERFNWERLGYLIAFLACAAQVIYALGLDRVDPLNDEHLSENMREEMVLTCYWAVYGMAGLFGAYCFLKAWGYWAPEKNLFSSGPAGHNPTYQDRPLGSESARSSRDSNVPGHAEPSLKKMKNKQGLTYVDL